MTIKAIKNNIKKHSNAKTFLKEMELGPITFSSIIQTERLCLEMNKKDFANLIKVSVTRLNNIEKGLDIPSINKVIEIATILNMPIDQYVFYAVKDMLNKNGLTVNDVLKKGA